MDTLSFCVIVTLCALNVFQFIAGSIERHKLVNKIMSRSFAEYERAKQSNTPPRESQSETHQLDGAWFL